jgi:NIMA-interacting peptidyl-prolyl cis-trans isomerase 1
MLTLPLLIALASAADPAPTATPPAERTAERAGAGAMNAERISVRHILVAYEGAERADPKLHRSREEAQRRAATLLSRLQAGEDFARVAREASDDPASSAAGGQLDTFGRGRMQAAFETAAFALAVGARSGVVESPFGFHILERLPLVEVHVAQILVQWQGLPGATVTRDREAARARAEEALAALRAGRPVAEVARTWSDGPAGPRGGDLGWFEKGKLNSTFDPIVFQLPPGGDSGIVETTLGLHILVRLDGV